MVSSWTSWFTTEKWVRNWCQISPITSKCREKIPLTMIKKYLNKGHRLFLDNYYKTPTLALHLQQNGMKLVSTVRPNRCQFPWDLTNADIACDESKFALTDTDVLAVKYRALQDKSKNKPKVVCLVSAVHANTVAASSKKLLIDCFVRYCLNVARTTPVRRMRWMRWMWFSGRLISEIPSMYNL